MKSSRIILTFYQNQQKLTVVELVAGQPQVLTIGSQFANVDVMIAHSVVSRVHAQVVWDGSTLCQVIDVHSTNGTFVNGVRLPAHAPTALHAGDQVAFGNAAVGSMLVGPAAADMPAHVPSPKAQSLRALLASKPEISIGRQAECDVVIDSPLASRLHAKLRQLPDGRIFLIDLGSTNGTFLNGRQVHGTVQLQPGDKIIIGRHLLTLDGGQRNLSGEIAIRTEGIEKIFQRRKVGLQATSISIPAGSLVAIMGPSGCGKSTLLKCLTGESPATRGKVFLHNLELIQHYPFLKTLIGYVPQDDIVHRELTVEQSLYFAARLRMERPTRAEIDRKIDEVLQRLHIEHIRHSPIGKVSGGQRKRVSIAVELLTDPLILFLDEPTSPLDPQTIEEFLNILRELAAKGTTVVMVTHKPEDLEYMDSVIFLAEGGAMVYDGPAADYKTYFGVRTAVEVYASISGPRAQPWIERFRGQHARPATASVHDNPRLKKRSGRGWLSQSFWLSWRYLRLKTNDGLNLTILIGQAPIIAALVCLIFSQLTMSVTFLITLSAIWFGTSNAAREIVSEAAIYRRERMFNLRIGPYLLSKLAILGMFGAVQSVLFAWIIAMGFQHTNPVWGSFEMTALWVWGLTICATAIGLAISALVDTAEKAMTFVPLVLIPQVMLAGVVARISQWPVEVLSYLSPTRWGNEGLSLIQGQLHDARVDGIDDPFLRTQVDSTVTARTVLEGQYHDSYEKLFGPLAYRLELDAAALLGITVALLLVVWIALWRKDSI